MKGIGIPLFAAAAGCLLVSLGHLVAYAKDKVVYWPLDGADGAYPSGDLIEVGHTLYGATQQYGANGAGTVFSLHPYTGKRRAVYSFCSDYRNYVCLDGRGPASLIGNGGTLYGITYYGGATGYCPYGIGCGTAFVLNPNTGVLDVLHSFCSKEECTDGAYPGNLVEVNGTLYGTTGWGGSGTGCSSYVYGCGTVFSLDPNTETEQLLYSFCNEENCTDGYSPGSLIDVSGTLYGAAEGGSNDSGVVFSLDPNTGAEKVLYSFCSEENCTDGAYPGGLIDVSGTLYGVTRYGGEYDEGTVFSLKLETLTEKVLYSFCRDNGCTDGFGPNGLIDVDGRLYGTTSGGGRKLPKRGWLRYGLFPRSKKRRREGALLLLQSRELHRWRISLIRADRCDGHFVRYSKYGRRRYLRHGICRNPLNMNGCRGAWVRRCHVRPLFPLANATFHPIHDRVSGGR